MKISVIDPELKLIGVVLLLTSVALLAEAATTSMLTKWALAVVNAGLLAGLGVVFLRTTWGPVCGGPREVVLYSND